jgi:hypothetical protein
MICGSGSSVSTTPSSSLIEAGARDDHATWVAKLEELQATGVGVTVDMVWLLSWLCGHHLADWAQHRGLTLDEALHQARLQGLDMTG